MVSRSENRIALISTTRFVIDPVQSVVERECPDKQFLHIMDEGILLAKAEEGKITPGIIDWLGILVKRAEASGCARAVVTCSSLSPAVPEAAELSGIPTDRIDYPLYLKGLEGAENPAVVMTNPTTREPSQVLIDEVRQKLGIKAQPEMVLLEDAFRRLNSGDPAGHDREVVDAVTSLAQKHDRIILAQISIARVRSALPEEIRSRVYSSLDFLPELINGSFD